jgi:hypothetical protein
MCALLLSVVLVFLSLIFIVLQAMSLIDGPVNPLTQICAIVLGPALLAIRVQVQNVGPVHFVRMGQRSDPRIALIAQRLVVVNGIPVHVLAMHVLVVLKIIRFYPFLFAHKLNKYNNGSVL